MGKMQTGPTTPRAPQQNKEGSLGTRQSVVCKIARNNFKAEHENDIFAFELIKHVVFFQIKLS